MAKLKKLLTVQVGKARATDDVLDLKISKTLLKKLRKLAKDGVLEIPVYQLFPYEFTGQFDSQTVTEVGVRGPEGVAAEAAPNVLDTAKDIIYGDREKAYGNPRFNLDSIAQLWTVYLHRLFHSWGIDGTELKAEVVAQMMALLKTARLIHNPSHFDSLVDQAGYAALQGRIQNM